MNVEKYKLQLEWMDEGTALFAEAMARLDLPSSKRATLLESWNAAQLISHVNSNARALINLTVWASTLVETPMYESAEQRARDIEIGAEQPLSLLIADFEETAGELSASIRSLSDDSLNVMVKSARGREIPAYEMVWMRIREIWIHAVDLDTGISFSGFPKELLDDLIEDVVGSFRTRSGVAAMELHATDIGKSWNVVDSTQEKVRIEGEASALLAWLIGRSNGGSLKFFGAEALPDLPAWL